MLDSINDVSLTPLSPLHIGSGDEYAPSNFVYSSEAKCLYCFDPSQAFLVGSLRDRLLQVAKTGRLSDIYQFFKANQDTFIPYTKQVLPSAVQLDNNINAILRGSNTKNLEIQRSCYYELPENIEQYIPGSSVKGVIHTALLDAVNAGEVHNEKSNLDQEILEGTMEKSPMRLINVSDFRSDGIRPYVAVVRANRCYKKDMQPSGIVQYFETIIGGQYRLFKGKIKISQSKIATDRYAYSEVKKMVKDLNKYFWPLFEKEFSYLARGTQGSKQWALSLKKLCSDLKPLFDNGDIALVKIGKNSGAESLVLHGANVASIRIKAQDGYVRQDHTTTFFAAEDAFNGQQAHIPFGWSLMEFNPKKENLVLKQWCEKIFALLQSASFDVETELNRLSQVRKVIDEKRQHLEEERQKELAAKLEAQKAEKEKELALASMSENERRVVILCEKLQKANDAKPGQPLNLETYNLLKEALDWTKEDQKAFAQKLRPMFKPKKLDEGGKGKEMKAMLRTLES